jgi:UDP-glucose 4-epimerase
MRILITGCGLIGCYTAKELMERADEVTFFDLQPNLDYLRKVLGRELPIIRGDIRELPALIEAMQRTRAEVVIHTAGLQGNRTPYFGFQVNLIGTLNVAEAVRLTGVRRLIHASSQGVYDLTDPPVAIDEGARRDGGARVYQGGKVACEEVLTAYAATYNFELALPRFASVYGYGPYTGGGNVGMDMYAMVQAALSGKPARMGPGIADANDFVYVKDIAQGLRLLTTTASLPHQAYNLGTGVAATIADIQRGLQKILGDVCFTREQPSRPRPALDISRARAELGYEPKFDIEAGLRDFIIEMQR